MQPKNWLVVIYLISMIAVVAGALLKIMHLPGGDWLLGASMVGMMVVVVWALSEVLSSRRLSLLNKTLWTVALLLFSGVATLVYLLAGRKQVLEGTGS